VCRYDSDIEVDYSGNSVTADAFKRVLTGRHFAGTSACFFRVLCRVCTQMRV
jgi:glycosylphosphatidylinositol transamidase (GPIT) subunit GPI8